MIKDIQKLLCYRIEIERELNSNNYTEALILNDRAYELLFSLYESAQSKPLKQGYSRELEYIAEKGKFLAIDIESSDVFLGDSNSEAVEVAKNKYPDHVFYVVRIGYSAAERLASMAL